MELLAWESARGSNASRFDKWRSILFQVGLSGVCVYSGDMLFLYLEQYGGIAWASIEFGLIVIGTCVWLVRRTDRNTWSLESVLLDPLLRPTVLVGLSAGRFPASHVLAMCKGRNWWLRSIVWQFFACFVQTECMR